MDYYIDVQVLPHIEFSDSILMDELFSYLHKGLVQYGKGEIGISFPNVDKKLGSLLRLHGNQLALERLMNSCWHNRLKDEIKVSAITPIPGEVTYRIVKRVQVKSNPERLIRRSVKKGWLSAEEAALKISNKTEKKLSLPYLKLKSISTGQSFRLFVEHGPILNKPKPGSFSAYGFSSDATIPWFQ